MSRRHIHLDPLGGIAGDMFVAAMLDAFPHCREQVFADIAAVLPHEAGVVRLTPVLKNGIAACHFALDETHLTHHHAHDHQHAIASDYPAIRALIDNAQLSGTSASHALEILKIIAVAESKIHGVPLEDVHFHELAAWDSLMDVVAAGSMISALGGFVETCWSIAPLPLGSGLVKTQHGLLPVPAPATALILQGYPWHNDNVPGERVTPTGAAIVRYLVPPDRLSGRPEGILRTGGYGAGTRNFTDLPNVLRVTVFDKMVEDRPHGTNVMLVQFDIDDMSGEEIGIAAERLRQEKGVLDLLLVPAQGKKGRPVTMFQVLIDPVYAETCSRLIFHETSTIGLRQVMMDRMILFRQLRRTDEGLRVKDVQRPDGQTDTKIESDELAPLAGLSNRRQTKVRAERSV